MSGIRSLSALSATASTSRVLNLHMVSEEFAEDPQYREAPFFRDSTLNQAVIIKHRFRSDEAYLVPSGGAVGTKIVFPLDRSDLRVGGQFIFINETGYKDSLMNVVGVRGEDLEHDLETLRLLNTIPSLDPFLVREQLRRHNRTPADCYFSISPADTARMLTFTEVEMFPLIKLAYGDGGSDLNPELVGRLANALLSTNADSRLEPLRLTLGLEGIQFRDGIFSWKGFIFYKWQFSESMVALSKIGPEMDTIKIKGRPDRVSKELANDLKKSIRENIRATALNCSRVLALYDDAFRDLVHRGHTAAFRKFLLDAPLLFVELGHMMGMVSHIVSYWAYRFRVAEKGGIHIEEYLDILREFSVGLSPRRH
ncbi:hypothetical protein PbB2_03008 [Candidatus Phycosocius bacilliformis]|uniref:Uncharacterized protein n=1 Tax=Candidatus Phycosocius bacilliformis TaxID=1445552 RepID=A0A2P2EE33_9PROT|nr:hypothetical protein PbB2_03008 [Candidatus Phycosocius bacilliformis]